MAREIHREVDAASLFLRAFLDGMEVTEYSADGDFEELVFGPRPSVRS